MNIKKIGKVLLVLFLVTVYFNVGYWVYDTWFYSRDVMIPNNLESFFQGPNRVIDKALRNYVLAEPLILLSVALWPIVLIAFCLAWLGYFIFFGGLFRAIGLYLSIALVLIGIFIALVTWITSHAKKTG